MGDPGVPSLSPEHEKTLQDVLGYLNFSSGKFDPRFHAGLNILGGLFSEDERLAELPRLLELGLAARARQSTAFSDVRQAEAVIRLTFGELLPAYRAHHADLLFHLQDRDFANPFFLARLFEAVLAQRESASDAASLVAGALDRVNDFLGHRPIAVLENGRLMQPYSHERFATIPLYVAGAGVAVGPHRELVAAALAQLERMPEATLRESHFPLSQLEELTLDPRAYDHAHPMYKRTNYMFGEWDPHQLNLQGRYRRFVLRGIILDALHDWLRSATSIPAEEALFEASVVLCGTMLMASTVSGSHPHAHDSTVSLSALLPVIARQRDAFYVRQLEALTGSLGERLRRESQIVKQPFGKVRQHLNLYVSRHGSRQIQHGFLAYLYARMGYPEASRRQSNVIPSASARVDSELGCRLSSAYLLLDHANRARPASPGGATGPSARRARHEALQQLSRMCGEIEDLLHRGIECGAIADPWEILGFQGNYPLFQAREDAVADPRIEQLLYLMEQIFALFSRALSETAAEGADDVRRQIQERFERLAEFWDRFATTTVEGLPRVSGRETFEAAVQVADALSRWHGADDAAGNLSFWRDQVAHFQTAHSYALVVDVLLQKQDVVASMALLIQWLSQADFVGLDANSDSFHRLVMAWWRLLEKQASAPAAPPEEESAVRRVESSPSVPAQEESPEAASGAEDGPSDAGARSAPESGDVVSAPEAGSSRRTSELKAERRASHAVLAAERLEKMWPRIVRFFDFAEANAGEYWSVPQLGAMQSGRTEEPAAGAGERPEHEGVDDEGDEDDEDLFEAAYENVVYRDSARDGNVGETIEVGPTTFDTDLDLLSRRLEPRLKFLITMSRLWQLAAGTIAAALATPPQIAGVRPRGGAAAPALSAEQAAQVERWLEAVTQTQRDLDALLAGIHEVEIAAPSGDSDSLIEFDRQIQLKHNLLHNVVHTHVAASEAAWHLASCLPELHRHPQTPDWEWQTLMLYRAVLRGRVAEVRQHFPTLLASLSKQPSLYVPLDKGGDPQQLLHARKLQSVIRTLLVQLPRLGLFRETWHLLLTARRMERHTLSGGTVITEFDRLFNAAFRNSVQSLLWQTGAWRASRRGPEAITDLVSELTEWYLKLWLDHSATMRLTTLESLIDETDWRQVKQFIRDYGQDFFHAQVLTLGNLRAILQNGVDRHLEYLEQHQDPLRPIKLLADLDVKIPRDEAVDILELVFRITVERFDRFLEYNTTTTHSDYGEQFYAFLDFLRLEASYERQAWNLSPLVQAHDVLVRQGMLEASAVWRNQFEDRTSQAARQHLQWLGRLEKKYGMQLPGVRDQFEERFVKVLAIDRMAALIPKAIADARAGRPSEAFQILSETVDRYLETSIGAGLDVPDWLRTLESEVENAAEEERGEARFEEFIVLVPQIPITYDEFRQQLATWETPPRRTRRKP